MSRKKKYEKNIQELRSLFLDPLENNRSALHEILELALSCLPNISDPLNPFLGNRVTDYDERLKPFEDIPSEPRSRSDVFRGLASVLEGQLRWHSPATMHNINPSIMLDAIVASAVANLYNPNPLWDFVSAGSLNLERQIIRQFANLVGWDELTGGAFTFGGKACLTYAIRLGLNRAIPEFATKGGFSSLPPAVIATESSHYSIETACSLLGIGRDACVWVKTHQDERIDLQDFQMIVRRVLEEKRPIAAVILCGGNTLSMAMDPVADSMTLLNEETRSFGLAYKPFVHFDSVCGWPWLFFKGYDFETNPLEIGEPTITQIHEATRRVSQTDLADSFGIDFHKDGFCPYVSSLFVTKSGVELQSIFMDEIKPLPLLPHGENFMLNHTIEHSRSSAPIFAAWAVLQRAGKVGFQSYLAHMISMSNTIRQSFSKQDFEQINMHSLGFCTIFWPINPNGPQGFRQLCQEDSDAIQQANQYTFSLFRQLEAAGESENRERFVLGYLPQYRKSDGGIPIAALRVYPMSIYSEEQQVTEIAERVSQIKRAFDSNYLGTKGVRQNLPSHVPK